MNHTNRHKLPDRIVKVIQGDYPVKKPNPKRMNVTDLIKDPLIRTLYIEHWDELEVDYSSFVDSTSTMGNALHERYEKYLTKGQSEVKFEQEIEGFTLVGKSDLLLGTELIDVKTKKVYGASYSMLDWERQLNTYCYLWRQAGQEITKLTVDCWYRNFDSRDKHHRNYPKCGVEIFDIPLWTEQEQEDYIRSQMHYHHMNPNVLCSPDTRGLYFEAHKIGRNGKPNKGAARKDVDYNVVKRWVAAQHKRGKDKYKIVRSEPTFCKLFCKSRSVCKHARNIK